MLLTLCLQVYENFVEEIDAIDNGISQWDEEPRYTVTSNLSSRVGHLNPRWNDKDQDTQVSSSVTDTPTVHRKSSAGDQGWGLKSLFIMYTSCSTVAARSFECIQTLYFHSRFPPVSLNLLRSTKRCMVHIIKFVISNCYAMGNQKKKC